MKSLSLARPLVIMVIGVPGSGKSFFARQFAEMFAAPLVSTDFVRHTIFPEPAFNPDEEARVGTLINNSVTELLKTQKTFIIDGGVNNRIARSTIERLARTHGYATLTIWVQTDIPTSRARSLKRNPQKATDAFNAPMSQASFERVGKQLTPPQPSENTVVISGKHTFSTQARIVLKKLVAPREDTHGLQNRAPITDQPSNSNDIQPRRRSVTIN